MEPETETETQAKIKETVVEILKSSDMDEMTESKLRNMASEKLGIDLSLPQYKTLVRGVVQSFISSIKEDKETKEEAAQEEEQQQHSKKKGERERDDDGELTICRVRQVYRIPNSCICFYSFCSRWDDASYDFLGFCADDVCLGFFFLSHS